MVVLVYAGILAAGLHCSNDTAEKPQSLYRQRIPNSSLVIYDFVYPGAFVSSSDYAGLAILDSGTKFSKSQINGLPSTYFAAPPTGTYLKMIDIYGGHSPTLPGDTMLTPARTYSRKINNIDIGVIDYNGTYGSALSLGLKQLEFGSFKETKDSIFFYQAGIKSDSTAPMTYSFGKGNIKIIDSSNGNIDYIKVEKVFIGRGNIYKPTKPFEIVPNQPIVGMIEYWFFPRKVTRTTELSDYGIFKRVE